MSEYITAQLVERIQRTSSVESFRFQAKQHVSFAPGQFTRVMFDEANPGNKELNKYLSFSSSPTNPYFEVTKRMSESVFSQRLRGLKKGDAVSFVSPKGSCVLLPSHTKIGFLIGGIGITPVISMIEYIVEKKLPIDTVLLYSNRTDDDIAFRSELDSWKRVHGSINICYSVTECKPKDKICIQGRLDQNFIAQYAQVCDERIFFIFGPPSMVKAIKGVCEGLVCDKENIKTESFIGYE